MCCNTSVTSIHLHGQRKWNYKVVIQTKWEPGQRSQTISIIQGRWPSMRFGSILTFSVYCTYILPSGRPETQNKGRGIFWTFHLAGPDQGRLLKKHSAERHVVSKEAPPAVAHVTSYSCSMYAPDTISSVQTGRCVIPAEPPWALHSYRYCTVRALLSYDWLLTVTSAYHQSLPPPGAPVFPPVISLWRDDAMMDITIGILFISS